MIVDCRLLLDKYNMSAPSCPTLPLEKQKGCRNLLKDYYASIENQLVKDHKVIIATYIRPSAIKGIWQIFRASFFFCLQPLFVHS